MRTILLTGANGFIGRRLLHYLKSTAQYQHDRVILLTSAAVPGYECIVRPDYDIQLADLAELDVQQIDIFIHLGSFTPKDQLQANDPVQCTSNINVTLKCLLTLQPLVKQVVFTSTLDVYSAFDGQLTEESPLGPVSLYGWSKLYAEQMVQQWAAQQGKLCQILRLGHIYGPGEEKYRKLIPHTIRTIHAGNNPVIYTEGKERRAFLHVDDCCRLIMKATELADFVGPINIVSDKSVAVYEIVKIIKGLMNSLNDIDVLNTAASGRDMVFDNGKMRQWLGAETIDLQEGLAGEIANFQF